MDRSGTLQLALHDPGLQTEALTGTTLWVTLTLSKGSEGTCIIVHVAICCCQAGPARVGTPDHRPHPGWGTPHQQRAAGAFWDLTAIPDGHMSAVPHTLGGVPYTRPYGLPLPPAPILSLLQGGACSAHCIHGSALVALSVDFSISPSQHLTSVLPHTEGASRSSSHQCD
jgi:hypothetical protein